MNALGSQIWSKDFDCSHFPATTSPFPLGEMHTEERWFIPNLRVALGNRFYTSSRLTLSTLQHLLKIDIPLKRWTLNSTERCQIERMTGHRYPRQNKTRESERWSMVVSSAKYKCDSVLQSSFNWQPINTLENIEALSKREGGRGDWQDGPVQPSTLPADQPTISLLKPTLHFVVG